MYKKNKRLLTIIIPCFNAEKYFDRCMLSLEGVNPNNVSILFINDGSTDLTQELINRWIKTHSNAYLINKENCGYSSAINTGLNNCNTEYVMFLGVDDELVADGINNICAHLIKNKPDILAFSTEKIYDDIDKKNLVTELDTITKFRNPGLYTDDIYSLYEKLGKDISILFVRDTSRCLKMETIGKTRYFGKTGISADGCFSSIVACKSQSFEFLNEVCYLWHLHKDSMSGSKKTIDKMEDELIVWAEFFTWITTSSLMKNIPEPIVDYIFVYSDVIDILYSQGRTEIALNHKVLAEKFSRKILKNHTISFKSRMKLLLPKVYNYIRRQRGNKN